MSPWTDLTNLCRSVPEWRAKVQSRRGFRLPPPAESVLKLRVCDHPNPLRERGIAFRGLRRVAGNPSLTRFEVAHWRLSQPAA